MKSHLDYFMESDEEILRLEVKTKVEDVNRQALWAGIKPGMRVADIGCGPGITSDALLQLVQPGEGATHIPVNQSQKQKAG